MGDDTPGVAGGDAMSAPAGRAPVCGNCDVPTDLVHEADGLLSLVAYRYRNADIPDDLRDELIACSLKFRRIGEERKRAATPPTASAPPRAEGPEDEAAAEVRRMSESAAYSFFAFEASLPDNSLPKPTCPTCGHAINATDASTVSSAGPYCTDCGHHECVHGGAVCVAAGCQCRKFASPVATTGGEAETAWWTPERYELLREAVNEFGDHECDAACDSDSHAPTCANSNPARWFADQQRELASLRARLAETETLLRRVVARDEDAFDDEEAPYWRELFADVRAALTRERTP